MKSPKKEAPKIIQICLSKATPPTAERRKAIENQDAEAQATVAFLGLTDAGTTGPGPFFKTPTTPSFPTLVVTSAPVFLSSSAIRRDVACSWYDSSGCV